MNIDDELMLWIGHGLKYMLMRTAQIHLMETWREDLKNNVRAYFAWLADEYWIEEYGIQDISLDPALLCEQDIQIRLNPSLARVHIHIGINRLNRDVIVEWNNIDSDEGDSVTHSVEPVRDCRGAACCAPKRIHR